MGKFIDLTRQQFGMLTVIERAENHKLPSGQRLTMWKCQCSCGKTTVVSSNNLKSGNVKSCGCNKSKLISESQRKHGYGGTRIYQEWIDMIKRCYKDPRTYPRYNGRGIIVCDEWRTSIDAFAKWAFANGYSDDLTIDRIDNNGNYEPSNCRWVTRKEQSNNYSRNILFSYNGKSQTISQWADEYHMKYSKLYSRLMRSHWTIEKALNTP